MENSYSGSKLITALTPVSQKLIARGFDARYLKAFEKKRCPQKESTAAHENADSKQTQPGSELKFVRASLADLP
jgi:hypothetical protein